MNFFKTLGLLASFKFTQTMPVSLGYVSGADRVCTAGFYIQIRILLIIGSNHFLTPSWQAWWAEKTEKLPVVAYNNRSRERRKSMRQVSSHKGPKQKLNKIWTQEDYVIWKKKKLPFVDLVNFFSRLYLRFRLKRSKTPTTQTTKKPAGVENYLKQRRSAKVIIKKLLPTSLFI